MILNDDRTGQLTYHKPPVSEDDLHAMADKAASTGVTTLCAAQYDG